MVDELVPKDSPLLYKRRDFFFETSSVSTLYCSSILRLLDFFNSISPHPIKLGLVFKGPGPGPGLSSEIQYTRGL